MKSQSGDGLGSASHRRFSDTFKHREMMRKMANKIANAGKSGHGNNHHHTHQSSTPRVFKSHGTNFSTGTANVITSINVGHGHQSGYHSASGNAAATAVVTFNLTSPNGSHGGIGLGSRPVIQKSNSTSQYGGYNQPLSGSGSNGEIENSQSGMIININEDSEMEDEISELIPIDASQSPPQSPKPETSINKQSNFLIINHQNLRYGKKDKGNSRIANDVTVATSAAAAAAASSGSEDGAPE